MKKNLVYLTVILLMFVFLNASYGATFSGTALGSWTNVAHDADDLYSIANNDAVTVAAFQWGVIDFSKFTFDGVGSNGGLWTTNSEDAFKIGDFTYRNAASNMYSVDGITGVDLNILLSVTSPLSDTHNYNFDFTITNTQNNTGDPVKDGDIVTANNIYNQHVFHYLDTDYTFYLMGFSSDNGATIRMDFSSPENGTASAGLYGKITSNLNPQIPEPTTLFLLGSLVSGIFGFSGLRRKFDK